MLDSERNSHETDNNREATGQTAGASSAPTVFNGPPEPPVPAVPAALFQPPQVLFQPPAPVAPPPAGERDSGDREAGGRAEADADTARPARRTRSSAGSQGGDAADDQAGSDAEGGRAGRRTRSRGRTARVRDTAPDDDLFSTESADVAGAVAEADGADSGTTAVTGPDDGEGPSRSRRRRRNTRSRGRGEAAAEEDRKSVV